jgi:hypothetical protein
MFEQRININQGYYMKKIIIALSLMGIVTVGQAAKISNIPSPLTDLLPNGSNAIQLTGVSADGNECVVDISNSSLGFSIDIVSDGEVAKAQIGLGHGLVGISQNTNNELVFYTHHKADEQFSRDTRSTATIQKNEEGTITSISVLEEEKGLLWGWSTHADIKCIFDNN